MGVKKKGGEVKKKVWGLKKYVEVKKKGFGG